jgi:hypothetical protein
MHCTKSGNSSPAEPRQAAAKPRYRARLDSLLKEMERGENQVEPGRRFDFGKIRRTLGMG